MCQGPNSPLSVQVTKKFCRIRCPAQFRVVLCEAVYVRLETPAASAKSNLCSDDFDQFLAIRRTKGHVAARIVVQGRPGVEEGNCRGGPRTPSDRVSPINLGRVLRGQRLRRLGLWDLCSHFRLCVERWEAGAESTNMNTQE